MGWTRAGGAPAPAAAPAAAASVAGPSSVVVPTPLSVPAPRPTPTAVAAPPVPTPVPRPVPTAPAAAPPPVPTPSTPKNLAGATSYAGHAATIFSMAYDPVHRQLASGSKDGTVLIWSDAGTPVHTLQFPNHYICSMDVHARSKLLFVCGVPTDTSGVPFVSVHDTSAGWREQGVLKRTGSPLISCLRCTGPDADGFVTGESLAPAAAGGAAREAVCFYDFGRGADISKLAPVQTYAEHEGLVTCVVASPTNANVFLSGSRDLTIRLWDRRAPTSVGMVGLPTDQPQRFRAHADMITCLDITGDLLLSTSVDGQVNFWDLRQLAGTGGAGCPPAGAASFDGQAVLKVAVSGAPSPNVAAVSTLNGLYLVDYANLAAPVVRPAAMFADGRPIKPYYDIKWGTQQGCLFAAGEIERVDVFQLS